jgi:hypothetical protein
MNDGRAIVYGNPLARRTDSARQRATRYEVRAVFANAPDDDRYTKRGLLPGHTAARIRSAVKP